MPALTEEVRDMFTGPSAISGRTSDSGSTPPVWVDHKGITDDHAGRVIVAGSRTVAFAAVGGRGWFFMQRDISTADVTGVFGLCLGNIGSGNHQEAGLFLKAKKVYSFGSGVASSSDGYKGYRCTCSNSGVWSLTRLDSPADDTRSVITALTTSTIRPLPLDDNVYQITGSAVAEPGGIRVIISDTTGEIINYLDTSANRITTAGAIGIDIFALNADNGGCIDYVIGYSMASADTIPPTVSSAAVANSTPNVVTLTMSETMDATSVPAASAFTVGGHAVSSVAISGITISLTLATPFVNGEAARTVAYAQPGANNARDIASTPNLLANFTGQAITNNVAAAGDTTAPALSTAQVLNSAPNQIVLTFNETLGAFTPAASAFAVSGGKTVSSVSRSGAALTLTCSAAYAPGDAITVTYTKPGSNQIQDAAGNQTNTFGPAAVTNNISNGTTRTWTSAVTFVNIQGSGANMQGVPQTGIGVTAYVNAPNGTLVDTKAGLVTDGNGKVPAWTGTSGSLGVNYRVTYVKDSNSNALATEILQAT